MSHCKNCYRKTKNVYSKLSEYGDIGDRIEVTWRPSSDGYNVETIYKYSNGKSILISEKTLLKRCAHEYRRETDYSY